MHIYKHGNTERAHAYTRESKREREIGWREGRRGMREREREKENER